MKGKALKTLLIIVSCLIAAIGVLLLLTYDRTLLMIVFDICFIAAGLYGLFFVIRNRNKNFDDIDRM